MHCKYSTSLNKTITYMLYGKFVIHFYIFMYFTATLMHPPVHNISQIHFHQIQCSCTLAAVSRPAEESWFVSNLRCTDPGMCVVTYTLHATTNRSFVY